MDKQTTEVMFSSASEEWQTPIQLFNFLDGYFRFTIDVAATKTNALCKSFYDKQANALALAWTGTWWCNPPYGRQLHRWVQKMVSSYTDGQTGVALLPSRTETEWHQLLYDHAQLIVPLRKRVQFVRQLEPKATSSAPFPSVLAVFSQHDWSHVRRQLATLGNVIVNTGIMPYTGPRKKIK